YYHGSVDPAGASMKNFLGCILLVASCVIHLGAGFLDHDEGVPYKWNTTTGVRIAIDAGPVKITNALGDPNANWDNQVGDVVFDNQNGVDVINLVRNYYNSLGTNLTITNVGTTAVP